MVGRREKSLFWAVYGEFDGYLVIICGYLRLFFNFSSLPFQHIWNQNHADIATLFGKRKSEGRAYTRGVRRGKERND